MLSCINLKSFRWHSKKSADEDTLPGVLIYMYSLLFLPKVKAKVKDGSQEGRHETSTPE